MESGEMENTQPVDTPPESKFIQPVSSFSVAVPLGEPWRMEVSVDNERKLLVTHFRKPDEIDLPEAKPLKSAQPLEPSPSPKVDPPNESAAPLLNHCPESPSTSPWRNVFGTNAESELTKMKITYYFSIQVNTRQQIIQFRTVPLVNETIARLNWLIDAAIENTKLTIVSNHLVTLKMILLACKAEYCMSNQDWSLRYALFQNCIIRFCADMEMYSEYSEGEIRPHQLGVDKTITECRNLVAHNTFRYPDQGNLIRNVMKCLAWYDKHFWPYLRISRNTSGTQFLNYEFHFPKAKIINQKISGGLRITHAYVPDFDAFADSGNRKPNDEWFSGISFR